MGFLSEIERWQPQRASLLLGTTPCLPFDQQHLPEASYRQVACLLNNVNFCHQLTFTPPVLSPCRLNSLWYRPRGQGSSDQLFTWSVGLCCREGAPLTLSSSEPLKRLFWCLALVTNSALICVSIPQLQNEDSNMVISKHCTCHGLFSNRNARNAIYKRN